ncbi:MAG: ABC transporter permease [Bacteroidetes bacterium]|nr:ABC transporter permease [Bacteroidota bacterium]MCY4234250.1 ABC transporter permease [Bacteroidota bacterium]
MRSLNTNRLRSGLTMLGIIIGIVTVTAMITVINGLESVMDNSLALLGSNAVYVQKTDWFTEPNERARQWSRPDLREDLADYIRDRSKYAVAIAPLVQTSRSIRYRDRSLSGVFLQGSTPELVSVDVTELSDGRWYNDIDNLVARNVVVIGKSVSESLFPNERAVGKEVRIGGKRFQIIGVLKEQGRFFGLISFDEQAQIPLKTLERHFGRFRSVTIKVNAESSETVPLLVEELQGIVRSSRGLDVFEEDDFSINKTEAFREQLANIKAIAYTIGIFLTGLALVVGGIGVMNIMFVTVKERTKEIGVRKAVGASRQAILSQFLIEAVMVCIAAGLIGILISLGVTAVVNQFIPATFAAGTVFLAFGICVGVGIIFGVVPAWNASRLNPIDALRYS